MSTLIEHRGVVRLVADGKAVVAMETGGCSSCGHGASCGIGKLASGRPATLLTVAAVEGVRPGDVVSVGLAQDRLTRAALLGYLFPVLAMLAGAWSGTLLAGSDSGTALGALGGFIGALLLSRLAIRHLPGLTPTPCLVTRPAPAPLSPTEFHHEH